MPTGPEHGCEVDCFSRTMRARSSIGCMRPMATMTVSCTTPGAHTHYSYALHDAVECIDVPVVEIHISDISKRGEFRRHSVIGSRRPASPR